MRRSGRHSIRALAAPVAAASVLLLGGGWLNAAQAASPADTQAVRQRLPEDEVTYFLLPDRFENGEPDNDRGGRSGDRLHTGYDPTHKGFYHGGDLKGLRQRLDYIQGLGATALWVGPIFVNKPVQGPPGEESAGYHGYWITDFMHVDPHLGTDAQFRELVDAAHARGLKVYMDIVVNHTADVIRYRECPDNNCPYRSRADYPYTRRGGVQGEAINHGFLGDEPPYQTRENFARLTRPDFAYTPFVPAGEEQAKQPAWLNDPLLYHNRGNSTFHGESSTMGDFSGLDDLMTENPRVLDGMIDIYGAWIERFGIDGFRIDTAQHVNPEFWQGFVPAMLARAASAGIPHFYIFGEVAMDTIDAARLARHTRTDRLPAVLDFGFANAVRAVLAGHAPTSTLTELFADDVDYEGGDAAARRLATFLSNHDAGRFGWFVRHDRPGISDAEALARTRLAYAMLLTLRGAPVIYSGDEQAMAGSGGDQDAREDLFATQVASYRDERLLTGQTLGTGAHFSADTPLYTFIAELSRLRSATPALRRGDQITRADSDLVPDLFAVTRRAQAGAGEVLVAFNTGLVPLSTQVEVAADSRHFRSLVGHCAPETDATGSVHVTIAPLDFLVCEATP